MEKDSLFNEGPRSSTSTRKLSSSWWCQTVTASNQHTLIWSLSNRNIQLGSLSLIAPPSCTLILMLSSVRATRVMEAPNLPSCLWGIIKLYLSFKHSFLLLCLNFCSIMWMLTIVSSPCSTTSQNGHLIISTSIRNHICRNGYYQCSPNLQCLLKTYISNIFIKANYNARSK